jgi:hypothetical protein
MSTEKNNRKQNFYEIKSIAIKTRSKNFVLNWPKAHKKWLIITLGPFFYIFECLKNIKKRDWIGFLNLKICATTKQE